MSNCFSFLNVLETRTVHLKQLGIKKEKLPKQYQSTIIFTYLSNQQVVFSSNHHSNKYKSTIILTYLLFLVTYSISSIQHNTSLYSVGITWELSNVYKHSLR